MNITTVGLDLAKNVFHLVGVDTVGKEQVKKRLSRSQVLNYFANLPGCRIGMEACASAHYFARELTRLGHEVKLIPPQYVKAYLRGQKNDYNDARAIAEAVRVPQMRFATMKTVEQQDVQSLVRLREGTLQARTALVNRLRGLLSVSPMKFIPVAEETGLIISIGEWVLRTACHQAREWQARGIPDLVVAVNFSVRQFAQKNLVQLIENILGENRLPAHCLDVEITESMLMDGVTNNVTILQQIKECGVSISVDDFGTGYSSLAYLQRLPIDTMKIDRSFVRDITGADSDAPIAKAVIALAHSLGMETIAEGVETQAQLDFMRAHGCKALQGYYFSPPLSVQDFTKLLEQGNTLDEVEAARLAAGRGQRKPENELRHH